MVSNRNLLLRVSILSIFRCHVCFRGGCSIGWFLKPFSKRNPWVGAIEAVPGVDACLPWILGLVMALVRTWTCSKSNSILLLYVVPWFHDQTISSDLTLISYPFISIFRLFVHFTSVHISLNMPFLRLRHLHQDRSWLAAHPSWKKKRWDFPKPLFSEHFGYVGRNMFTHECVHHRYHHRYQYQCHDHDNNHDDYHHQRHSSFTIHCSSFIIIAMVMFTIIVISTIVIVITPT